MYQLFSLCFKNEDRIINQKEGRKIFFCKKKVDFFKDRHRVKENNKGKATKTNLELFLQMHPGVLHSNGEFQRL